MMGRYRPPQPKSSPYITPEGYKALQQEQDNIWKKRSVVTRALTAAAAEGDRSENAEYIYRKKELRELDRRIRYLQKRLPDLKVVRELPRDSSRIYFGAWVGLIKNGDQNVRYRIVGADELDAKSGKITIDSPLARALMGKQVDDEVSIETAAGVVEYCVESIEYETI